MSWQSNSKKSYSTESPSIICLHVKIHSITKNCREYNKLHFYSSVSTNFPIPTLVLSTYIHTVLSAADDRGTTHLLRYTYTRAAFPVFPPRTLPESPRTRITCAGALCNVEALEREQQQNQYLYMRSRCYISTDQSI